MRILKTYELVNNNLCGKLVSLLKLPIAFYEGFKVASIPFFIPDFNLLSCELDNFAFILTTLRPYCLYKVLY